MSPRGKVPHLAHALSCPLPTRPQVNESVPKIINSYGRTTFWSDAKSLERGAKQLQTLVTQQAQADGNRDYLETHQEPKRSGEELLDAIQDEASAAERGYKPKYVSTSPSLSLSLF